MRLLACVLPGEGNGTPLRMHRSHLPPSAFRPAGRAPLTAPRTALHAGGVGSALLEGRGQGSVSAAAECESFLTCLSVVVALLLPAYVAVKTEPADSLQRWEAAQLSRAAGAGSGAAGGPAARLQQALARFEASVGGGIRHVFCGRSWLAGERPAAGPEPGLPVRQLAWYERLGAWWLLLALVYQLAVQAAAAA